MSSPNHNDTDPAAGSSGQPPRGDHAPGGEGAGQRQKDETPSREIGGRDGPDPSRYGDWEKNGRCIDF